MITCHTLHVPPNSDLTLEQQITQWSEFIFLPPIVPCKKLHWILPTRINLDFQKVCNESGLTLAEKLAETVEYYLIIEWNRKKFTQKLLWWRLNSHICVIWGYLFGMVPTNPHYLLAERPFGIRLEITVHQFYKAFGTASHNIANHRKYIPDLMMAVCHRHFLWYKVSGRIPFLSDLGVLLQWLHNGKGLWFGLIELKVTGYSEKYFTVAAVCLMHINSNDPNWSVRT